ncbi:MAG: type II secretion system protein [Cyanobacteria bacterium SIG32]|nr:type II secretion system protein [Cyanobacteria bacterium SIG32]
MKKTVKNLITWSPSHLITSQKSAFTLAEVLITLAIIGVVAAMTIPTLIANYQEKQTVTALRKFQTNMTQAYLRATVDHGYAIQWEENNSQTLTSQERCHKMFEKFRPYLKIAKDCGSRSGCFGEGNYKKIDGTETSKSWDYTGVNWYKVILSDGMSVLFFSRGPVFSQLGNTTEHGTFIVDINGKNGPNMMGKDTFTFFLTNNGVVPDGNPSNGYQYKLKDDEGNYIVDDNGEYVTTTDTLLDCNRTKCLQDCEACTAWVIENGNMDYLHCDDLSWNGKRKCSE